MLRTLLSVITATLLTVALVGCGGSGRESRPSAPKGVAQVRIANYAFHPKTVTLRVGAKVTVTNDDSTAHTATARSGAFDTGTIKPGHSVQFTLRRPGIYQYYCQFHAFMTGTIRVLR